MRTKSLLLLLLITSMASADTFLIRTDGVYKKMIPFVPGDTVIIGDKTPPPPGDDDDDDDDDDTKTIAEKVRIISKSLLRDGREGATVALAVQQAIGKENRKQALQANLERLKTLFPNNKFDEWFFQVSALITSPFTDAFLVQVEKGVTDAFVTSGAEKAFLAQGRGGTPGEMAQAFDFLLIMRAVKCVIDNLPERALAEAGDTFGLILKIVGCILGEIAEEDIEPIPDPLISKSSQAGYIGSKKKRTTQVRRSIVTTSGPRR